MQISADTPVAGAGFHVRHLAVEGALRDSVKALLAVEIEAPGPIPLTIVPHDSLVLCVNLGRGAQAIEKRGEHGSNVHLTGIRNWTGAFSSVGDCVALFALLTPLGSVNLLESQPLQGIPRIRAPLADLLEWRLTRQLESDIALADGLEAKLRCFGAWLESRATANRRQSRAALRAGRAAMRLCADPKLDTGRLADEQHVSRRQLERDFGRWIGTSPKHLAQVAQVQSVSRIAQGGLPLAGIAAEAGFADQAHMSRVVRQITGLTPQRFVRSPRTPLASGFRAATGGGTVYL